MLSVGVVTAVGPPLQCKHTVASKDLYGGSALACMQYRLAQPMLIDSAGSSCHTPDMGQHCCCKCHFLALGMSSRASAPSPPLGNKRRSAISRPRWYEDTTIVTCYD